MRYAAQAVWTSVTNRLNHQMLTGPTRVKRYPTVGGKSSARLHPMAWRELRAPYSTVYIRDEKNVLVTALTLDIDIVPHHKVHVLGEPGVHGAVLPRDGEAKDEGERVVKVPILGGEESDAQGCCQARAGRQDDHRLGAEEEGHHDSDHSALIKLIFYVLY